MSQEVCGCDNNTYDNAMEATSVGVIVNSYGVCPPCYPQCSTGQVCCEGCYDTFVCVPAGYGCPAQTCGDD
jgi:hypothetical protein